MQVRDDWAMFDYGRQTESDETRSSVYESISRTLGSKGLYEGGARPAWETKKRLTRNPALAGHIEPVSDRRRSELFSSEQRLDCDSGGRPSASISWFEAEPQFVLGSLNAPGNAVGSTCEKLP